MTANKFSPIEFLDYLYKKNTPKYSFNAEDKKDACKWQHMARKKLVELIGEFPKNKVPLKSKIINTKNFRNYIRETILFQSREGMDVFGYLLIPKSYKGRKLASVICLSGHGRGCDDIVGIEEDGSQRKWLGGTYQADFAVQCVNNGFIAFAIEQFLFGHRGYKEPKQYCDPASLSAFLFGQTMISWRVYDVIRAIDYLSTRKEIDPSRVGCMGISGGGTISFFSACIDERIKAAFVSGYFNTFKGSMMKLRHCSDNYVPNILKYFEMYDLAGLIAPRGLFIESGIKDTTCCPIKTAKLAFEKAEKIYKVFNAEDKIAREMFRGHHRFKGDKGFKKLKEWL